tara:strand:- start:469 stop:681 length:213 start_codon:yes stop_codon:yes gene_type:complete
MESFKTPIYQRNACAAYLERNKNNTEFQQHRLKIQRDYYWRKKARLQKEKEDQEKPTCPSTAPEEEEVSE